MGLGSVCLVETEVLCPHAWPECSQLHLSSRPSTGFCAPPWLVTPAPGQPRTLIYSPWSTPARSLGCDWHLKQVVVGPDLSPGKRGRSGVGLEDTRLVSCAWCAGRLASRLELAELVTVLVPGPSEARRVFPFPGRVLGGSVSGLAKAGPCSFWAACVSAHSRKCS